MIRPVSFSTTSAAISAVRADLVTQGFTGPVNFGRKFLKQRRDPTSGGMPAGSVVVCPPENGNSPLRAPRLTGGNPRPTFTVSRALEIHCWSTGPLGSFPSQYEADFSAAEILTAAVLRSFEIYVPGAKAGGRSDPTEHGETVFGVEIVTALSIDLEQPDTTYQIAIGAVFKPNYAMQFPDGNGGTASTDTGSDQF